MKIILMYLLGQVFNNISFFYCFKWFSNSNNNKHKNWKVNQYDSFQMFNKISVKWATYKIKLGYTSWGGCSA